jgi:two-component system cell cycle sensor histidine kinase/response regulator CckA
VTKDRADRTTESKSANARDGLFSLHARTTLGQIRLRLARLQATDAELEARLDDLEHVITRWEEADRLTDETLLRSLANASDQKAELEQARLAVSDLVENLHEDRARLLEARAALDRDITERRRAEEALQRSEASFRTLVERLPDPLFVHRDGVLVYANPAFLTWLGLDDAKDLVGRTVFEAFVHPEDRGLAEERIRLTKVGGGAQAVEVRFVRRDGQTRVMDTTGVRLVFDGEPANVVIARDITDQREMQARLLLSDRMASVGTLAAGVAHEINNPLAYVTANLDMIAEEIQTLGRDDPSARTKELGEMTQEARHGAERVRKIVRGLKTFSRLDEEQRVTLDVRQVLDLSINMAFNEVRHRARLVKDYGDAPSVEADEARLGQVFINLLVNAAQAIPEGQADRNEIRLVTSTDASGRAVVEVRDTGRGIAGEHLRRIFDPFFTTKAIGEGTGLGLSICHNHVVSLGGQLTVSSEVGKGAVFRVSLPPARSERVVRPLPQPISTRPPTRRGQILVVDDDLTLGSAFRRVLDAEHDVTFVTNGREALAQLTSGKRFDVILCDLMMPEMTGMDLYAELRKVAPDVIDRMMFITGGAFSPTARQFLDQVPNQRFEKPFDVHTLRAAVRGFLR